ncbi:MAG: hypothetical protein LBQ81_02365 [Zoogloeaceae bacterium]|nr:hypothetical protein [Zoogloeaceae bacterium]
MHAGRTQDQAVFWTDLKGKLQQDAPEIAGYSHSFTGDQSRHIINHHGDTVAEAARRQIAVTAADVARIPEIVTQYDAISSNQTRDKYGNTMNNVVYAKAYPDATVVYVETIAKTRQNMRGVTMMKYPPMVDAATALQRATTTFTSETVGGMSKIIADDSNELNQSEQGESQGSNLRP